jgi:fumarate reductase flavoprotein subunit
MIVGDTIADFCDSPEGEMALSTALVTEFGQREQSRLAELTSGRGTESAYDLTRQMQETMTANVGIFRHAERLEQAVATLQDLQRRSRSITLRSNAPGANPELTAAYRVQRMLKLAQCVAFGALQRTESRGAHYRDDFPRRDDLNWMRRTLASWPDARATLPTLRYEELDIMRMEMPPGWRGYGARDYIENPSTALRQSEIDATLSQLKPVDRQARQEALMPFRHLLPQHLRGPNERLGDES